MSKLEQLIKEYCPNGVEYKPFREVCDYVRGVTYNKSNEINDVNDESWELLRANNINVLTNTLLLENIKQINKEVRIKEGQFLKQGDILICAGSGSREHVGKVAYIFHDMKYAFGGFMAVIRAKVLFDNRYLFHMFTTAAFSNFLNDNLNTTTINNLSSGLMKSFMIPVPPIAVQEEIARILDDFTELAAELAAEIEARKQQYEYYRDKLLTFKVLEN